MDIEEVGDAAAKEVEIVVEEDAEDAADEVVENTDEVESKVCHFFSLLFLEPPVVVQGLTICLPILPLTDEPTKTTSHLVYRRRFAHCEAIYFSSRNLAYGGTNNPNAYRLNN
jgi:hypothetical protein